MAGSLRAPVVWALHRTQNAESHHPTADRSNQTNTLRLPIYLDLPLRDANQFDIVCATLAAVLPEVTGP
jgi:hypothetical protein